MKNKYIFVVGMAIIAASAIGVIATTNQAQARGFCSSNGEEHQEQHHTNNCTPAGGHPEEAPGHERG